MARILIVEDEPAINELLCRNLTLVGHECVPVFSGAEARELMKRPDIDLVLLDIMLPGTDGLTLMRDGAAAPVIFITAMAGLSEKLRGLELGADDYITKPFETLEVIARVNVVLRRAKRQASDFVLDSMRASLCERRVFLDGREIELTPREFALLEALILNRNLALSREKLLELAWGYDYMGDTRTVDVHIQKLRKKLRLEERLKTVYKLGYRLETK